MRNLAKALPELLGVKSDARKLSKVLSRIGADLYLVADSVSAARQSVSASGLNIGDYILHEDNRLIHNLGPVTVTVYTS